MIHQQNKYKAVAQMVDEKATTLTAQVSQELIVLCYPAVLAEADIPCSQLSTPCPYDTHPHPPGSEWGGIFGSGAHLSLNMHILL